LELFNEWFENIKMDQVIIEIKEKISEILEKNGVKKAALFGSIVRGDYTEKSDIDILIEFEGDKSLLDLVRLQFLLEEACEKKVDLLTYNSIHPLLKNRILEEQVIIL